ncbi:unnamed protein product [Cuscuta epithymum]|uniref:Uncharacterized protein n=1 Tax=Cuscuta epithymum TaxID=186058 RepID=A0AAV0DGS7_9ASTE|nr:unnamed protein product [Cuscuta epithymum]
MAAKGGGHGGGGNGGRGRSYALLLMLAFGAAILGVMILHKFRERRIFNLLVQEKDRQLLSLHLLLQKEKDSSKDAKKQIDDMRGKIHKLRTKKADLEARIQEMDSTISSLKEEQRTISSSLEEKQKQINALMDYKRGESRESARLTALSEALQKKAAEIDELKRRVNFPVKVWSVRSDDRSNLPVNFTSKASGVEIGNDNRNRKDAETSVQTQDRVQEGKNETSDSQQVSGSRTTSTVVESYQSREDGVNSDTMGRKLRGKRRRIISYKNLKSENGVKSMRSRKSFTDSESADVRKKSNLQTLPDNSTLEGDDKLLNKLGDQKPEEIANTTRRNKDRRNKTYTSMTEKRAKEDVQETAMEEDTYRKSNSGTDDIGF